MTDSAPLLSDDDRARLGLHHGAPADPVGLWRTVRSRTLAWGWRHRRSLPVLVLLLAVTAIVRFWGLAHGPAFGDDEGTYMAQAWAVQHQHGLAPYTYWYDHPPFGWLQLSVWTWLTDAFGGNGLAIVSGRRLMVWFSVLDAGLLFVLARRLGLRRLAAATAVALWALSPLAVGMSRMVYLDNLALPWLLAAFVLAASPRRDLWAHTASGLCFAAAVLTKETSLIVLPALVLLLWQRSVRQTRTFCLTGFATGFLLLAAAYPLLATLKGELLPGPGHVSLVEALRFQFLSRPSTGTLLSAGSGSRRVLDGWLSMDGLLLLGGLLAAVPALLFERSRAIGVALALLLVAAVRPGYLPQPFAITVLPFAALAVAAAVESLWVSLGNVRARASWQHPQLRYAAVGTLATAVLLLVVPSWVHGNRALAQVDQSAPTAAAVRWLDTHHQTGRLLVDDTVWSDLVSHGYAPSQVVWFYKLDFVNNLDPSVRQRIHGYGDLHIMLSTPVIRAALHDNTPHSLTLVRDALAHSTVVATFGQGPQRIEIRTITPATPATPATPSTATTTP